MAEVSIRELRNKGGDVVDRAAKGEAVTITRAGTPVAELRPLRDEPKSLGAVLAARRHLPPIDVEQFRDEIDDVLDASL